MTISFNQVPNNIRVPFLYAEFDSSNAQQGPSQQPFKTLVIGQKLAAGSAAALTPVAVTKAETAKSLFGEGSHLHLMFKSLLANDSLTEAWALPMSDHASGVAASGKVSITGPATAAGTLALYIAGKQITVGVTASQTAASIATALAAAIQAQGESMVSAAVNGVNLFEVDLTAKNKGLLGNAIDLRMNYADEDKTPAGVGVTITAMAGGSQNPDISAALAALSDTQYNVIVFPYNDSAALGVIESELETRWGPLKQNEGYAISASNVAMSALSTLGDSRNSGHCSIIGATGIPEHPMQVAAAAAGQVAYSAAIDPARPFQTLTLKGVSAPKEVDRFSLEERNILLYDGIATVKATDGGTVIIERMISTFKTNALGAASTAFLDAETHFTLSYLRYDFRNHFLSKYPRHKLAGDGIRISAGQKILTPKTAKAEAISKFRDWEKLGLVENIDQFKKDLIVERNATDTSRLDFLLPPDLVNQMRVFGVQIGFLL